MSEIQRRYSLEEIDGALLAYWLEGLSSTRAADVTGIPETTIRRWVEQKADRLNELRQKNEDAYDERIALKAEGIQIQALDTIAGLVEQTDQQMRAGTIKAPDQAAQRISTVLGIVTDKWLLIKGRPNTIVGSGDASEHLRALKQKFPWLVVDSTAEEDTTPALPDPDDATEAL